MTRWHRGHVRSPYGVALVAEVRGEVVGMLVGSAAHSRHVAWVLRHERATLGLLGLAALLARPALWAAFLRTRLVRYARRLLPDRRAVAHPPAAPHPVAVIAALVVEPHLRGAGAGSMLVTEFVSRVEARGAARAELVTTGGERGAEAFYRRLGWREIDRHLDLDGDVVVRLGLDLPSRPSTAGAG